MPENFALFPLYKQTFPRYNIRESGLLSLRRGMQKAQRNAF